MAAVVSLPASAAPLSGNPILDEARIRFNLCSEWESTWRPKFISDIKFRHGDSYNGYQWPDRIRQARDLADRPCLTMNQIRQHNLQIVNEAKRNKSSARLRGTGNGATQESANCLMDIIRNIERQSVAQMAYTTAREFQVDGGIGYWRLVTEYESNESFDQELFVKPITDPLSVFLDPDLKMRDGSDARYGFIFDFILKEEFDRKYPEFENVGTTPLGLTTQENFWLEKDHIMICEYFRKVPNKDVLVSFVNMGTRYNILKSKLPGIIWSRIKDDPLTKTRDVEDEKVEWKLIAGDEIVDETDWVGKYIPIIRVVGEETVIEGLLDRKGHTRAMLDPQRMYNYNASGQVEYGALQSKVPWVAPAKAIEEFETMWNSANNDNYSVLPWNHVDDDNPDTPIPPPFRPEPPQFAPLYQAGMETAFNQMMMTSGQWQNQMGMMGNERTGRAIAERQEQSDTATYHFQDHYEDALKYNYRQMIDIIPKLYDTKRIKQIMGNDGVDMTVVIDPGAQKVYMQELDHENRVVQTIFNPQLGKYDVAEDIGPSTATKRKENADALTLILTQAPGLTGVIGDLLMKSLDFDEAQEAALRLKRMVPPQALGEGPSPNEQAMQEQLTSLQGLLAKAIETQGKDKLKIMGKEELRDIEVYNAETDRITALGKLLPTDQEGLGQLVQQLVEDALRTHLTEVIKKNVSEGGSEGTAPSLEPEAPPLEGAQKAPDGMWYILDPTRRGKYLRVGPLAQERTPPRA